MIKVGIWSGKQFIHLEFSITYYGNNKSMYGILRESTYGHVNDWKTSGIKINPGDLIIIKDDKPFMDFEYLRK